MLASMASQSSSRINRIVSHLAPVSCSSSAGLQTVTGATAPYKNIHVQRVGRVGVITLYRPQALNALCTELIADVVHAAQAFDSDNGIGCILLTGHGRAFAAGADISQMKDMDFMEMSTNDYIKPWEAIGRVQIPIVVAINGFALGGGCEVAMMGDVVYASDKAKFGQPEIKIGTIPGAGGTQRLTRAIGKAKTMELVLTGDMISAEEAERAGLVARVLPHNELVPFALKQATKIANLSKPIVKLCKESVLAASNTTLDQGMQVERRLFHSTFALADRREGMQAFADKRKPQWKHR